MMRGEGATAGRRRVGVKIVVAIAATVTAVAVALGCGQEPVIAARTLLPRLSIVRRV